MTSASISPEQRLFVGVIVNAAQEAAGVSRVGVDRTVSQQTARDWFDADSEDFRAVCEMAGLEPSDVRRRVLDYLKRVEDDPTTLVKNKRVNMPARHRDVSIPDVARHAGVSATTVSNVIRARPHVTPGTRARVLAAIDELGYKHSVH